MALYDMTQLAQSVGSDPGGLVKLKRTSFGAQNIHERAHLQAALRDQIDVIDDQLFVVSEEFGAFEGVSRRIDLLCVDKACRLVVVELKRTADGGHMELQALRYAAMVSTMTFDQLVQTLVSYRGARGQADGSESSARSDLLAWIDADEDDEPVVPRDVGIVLASEDFSPEITTTVLWLNEFHGFDMRCVRLRPYLWGERLLLDVQQVIPLPEASAYTVRVREKENAVRQAQTTSSADWTKFVIVTPTSVTEPLPKRWAMLRLVEGLFAAGTSMEAIEKILPSSKLVSVYGSFATPQELWAAVQDQHDKGDDSRWHLNDPIVDGDRMWVLHNNWGTQTRRLFSELLEIAPAGFAVHEEGSVPPADPAMQDEPVPPMAQSIV